MTAALTTHRLDVPGGNLYYEVRGSGPLLLVIGQPMTSAPFGPLADFLAEDHTVVTYDPHGLGESTVTDPSVQVTPQLQADDLALLVEAVGGRRVRAAVDEIEDTYRQDGSVAAWGSSSLW